MYLNFNNEKKMYMYFLHAARSIKMKIEQKDVEINSIHLYYSEMAINFRNIFVEAFKNGNDDRIKVQQHY
jgi:hypothetical protein